MGALRDVELVEEDVAGEGTPPVRRRRWWWLVAAAVAVAGLLVGGQAWADARHAAHLARFDDVAGVVPPIPEHPAKLWTYQPYGSEMDGATEVGSRLVAGTVSAATREYRIRQIDRATGATVWSARGTVDPSVDLGTEAYAVCRPLDEGHSSLVACALGQDSGGVEGIDAEQGQIVTLDAADGSNRGSVVGRWAQWDAAGGRLVTARPVTTGTTVTWTLRATDPRGHETWARTLPPVDVQPEPEADDDGVIAQSQYFSTDMEAAGSRTVLADQGHLFVLDDAVVTASLDVGRGLWPRLERGAVVLHDYEDLSTSTLVTGTGRAVSIPGTTLYLPVDDGSDSDVLLVQELGRVSARDATTGAVLWSTLTNGSSAVVLGGRAYLGMDTMLGAFDLRTGDVLWREPSSSAPSLVTDGRGVWASGETSLQGFALDDGSALPARDVTDLVPHEDGGYSPLDARLGMLAASDDRTVQVVG
ncbi:PQQ-binding-like beta-propeller repeat protein [Cellulomonas sp. PhB150]|uniref:outer membrane protein assembly factor BamB family protein n=1 Tax=Cellulomonas sp. PhB150 TaxID=2485188 RepID=UPI000F4A92A6|nr:PQQ-binding-like beta-propeller repeat protein [Cellulomonas sp. PhB150]ROS25846.1 putative pyrroloquinoline-quinone binding quinoprotein [Cellulomonas sp. PhB150]